MDTGLFALLSEQGHDNEVGEGWYDEDGYILDAEAPPSGEPVI